jgi:hypothetical protein
VKDVNDNVAATESAKLLDDIFMNNIGESHRKEQLDKILEFNGKFGKYGVTIEVIGEYVVAKFLENPQQLATKLVTLGGKRGMDLKSRNGSFAPVLSSNGNFVNLLLTQNLDCSRWDVDFDPVKHEKEPTVILPTVFPGFLISLIETYISAAKETEKD